jgi:Carbohydrate family 9 binding domain-like
VSKRNRGLLIRVALLLGVLLMTYQVTEARGGDQGDLVNLTHLRFLTEAIKVDGREMALVHIYSEYPKYLWVDAAGEGISAIDDVARAAVVYLWQYERTGEAEDLKLARQCLEFVRYMQAPDGEFYNFVVDRTGKINRTGNTSYKALDWWAMRSLWALGEGVRVFDKVDRAYADTLAQSYLLTETALGKAIRNYGQTTDLHGFKIPSWIPNGAPDSSSIGLLGMSTYYQARPNPATADIIAKIAEGVAAYRLGNHYAYPFGMHPVSSSAPGYWHDWGAHMVHALAVAGMTLKRQDWIDSAAADADSFLLRQIAFERFRDMGVVPDRLGQIAYGTNMIVQAYMALYKATGQARYARYGGLAASWLFGNNMANVQMYDPKTGRVFDGINGPAAWRVNLNSGAESTIEGLMSLQAVADVPLAAQYLYVRPISQARWIIAEAEQGERISGEPIYYSGNWTGESNISSGRYVSLGKDNVMELKLAVEADDDYLIYVAHVRQAKQQSNESAQALRIAKPPTIDGKLDEWSAIPALRADSQKQFLRGVGLWQGPDVDSHAVQLTWDQDNLYLAASVRDPEHVQRYKLSEVWHDDALWIYLINNADAQRLSAKFTLAQTPDGPQVWDWINSRFVAGATMAWTATKGGYIYEAAVPWKSLGVDQPRAGLTIGIEAGRGIGGNSFMDLTGRDPDITSNLLRVVLADPASASSAASTESGTSVLRVQLDGGKPQAVEESVSPDRAYWWLDLVWKSQVHLTRGEHSLRYAFAGTGDGRSRVDAFYVQPAVARRIFRHPDGRLITLTYNTLTGEANWDEAAGQVILWNR